MKTFEINTKSWHYWLATKANGGDWRMPTDICAYSRMVVFAIFLFTFLGFAAACGVFLLVFILSASVVGLSKGYLIILVPYAMITFFVWLLFLRKKPIKAPSFVKEAYSAHKEKYCVKVEYR